MERISEPMSYEAAVFEAPTPEAVGVKYTLVVPTMLRLPRPKQSASKPKKKKLFLEPVCHSPGKYLQEVQ